jgi:small-conductance mechanosensitive channel
VLREEVTNYSGPDIPFIWNEIPIQVAYTSDLQFVEECLLSASTLDFKEQYPHMAASEIEHWQPAVYFRVSKYAWMEAVVSYPVEPYDTTGRRNRILKIALPILNAAPDKVKFPEGTLR